MGVALSVNLSGLKLRNPTILASGIVGLTIPLLRRAIECGAGGVVTKSIGVKPREGYKAPNVVEVEGGYVNAIGLSNPGMREFRKELESKGARNLPLVVSIFGGKPSEFEELVSNLDLPSVKAFELNLSCPHVKGVGTEVGHDPKLVGEVVRAVKRGTRKPVFAKLSPNVTEPSEIARAAERAGADGITAINTVRAMTIDFETGRPILSNRVGGLSGVSIKPVSLRCVYEIFEAVKIPIIGCGGISSWMDIVEFFEAGASAVQLGTYVGVQGVDLFGNVVSGLRSFLEKKRCGSLNEIIGIAHRV